MSDFRKTGDYLRKKYNGAIQVTMNQDGTGFTVANKNFRKPTKTDLVYFENSPDYCVMDKSAGKNQSSSWGPKAALSPLLPSLAGLLWDVSSPTKPWSAVGLCCGGSPSVSTHWSIGSLHRQDWICPQSSGFPLKIQSEEASFNNSSTVFPQSLPPAEQSSLKEAIKSLFHTVGCWLL